VAAPDNGQAQQINAISPAEKMILRDGELHDGEYLASLAEKYYKNVRLLTPFLPDEMLASDDMSKIWYYSTASRWRRACHYTIDALYQLLLGSIVVCKIFSAATK
jgi:hypothetical protein